MGLVSTSGSWDVKRDGRGRRAPAAVERDLSKINPA